VSSGYVNGLPEQGLVCPSGFRGGCDCSEVRGVFGLGASGVQLIGELLEAAGCFLDLVVEEIPLRGSGAARRSSAREGEDGGSGEEREQPGAPLQRARSTA
jgi:hypothetical protein